MKMDDEDTAGYREPCAQCSAVDWGVSDEGRFYCRSCHIVIERTKEVVDPSFTAGSSRVSTLSRGTRTKKPERGRQWMVCEGFQFILRNQADALLQLGVDPRFKDEVLCQLWRLYLQRSRQAFTHNPVTTARFQVRGPDSDSGSAAESSVVSASETDGDANLSSTAGSNAESSSDWSLCSGSVDAVSYLSPRLRRTRGLMTMKKTLALIHLALIWIREPLTLSDLLSLVNEGHVPYVNAYEKLPDEMRLEGKDALIFRVQSVPSHRVVHQEAHALLLFLQLPAFPPISRQSLLHPALLTLRYLADANLPDELHPWVCRLTERAGMADQAFNTINAVPRPVLPRYDVHTAALIIVTMKLLFGLDDHTEWDLSNEAGNHGNTGDMFNLRRWYRLLQAALTRAQQRRRRDIARRQWTSTKPLYPNRKDKSVVLKKKRVAEQVQICFERLSSGPAGAECDGPSSFRFCWGDEDGADGPSLHRKKLDAVLTLNHGVPAPANPAYWHPALRPCNPRKCRSHYSEAALPRTFVWLLQLFSFLLDVKPAYLYEEVLKVERRVVNSSRPRRRKTGTGPGSGPAPTRTETRPRRRKTGTGPGSGPALTRTETRPRRRKNGTGPGPGPAPTRTETRPRRRKNGAGPGPAPTRTETGTGARPREDEKPSAVCSVELRNKTSV